MTNITPLAGASKMDPTVKILGLTKKYNDGKVALENLSFDILAGEIIALLGPNGAGKTTLISIICGLTTISSGTVLIDGYDVETDYRAARTLVGLVPQELMLEPFETVVGTINLSRGLFGKGPNSDYVESILKQLSLWEKRNSPIRELSGGMKRRVLIAKALSHEPKILFLDEPTAGVDVDLRRDMWELIKELKRKGVTVVLTTHYIEEAEEIADRIAVINDGKILLVEDKDKLMRRLGKKQLRIELGEAIEILPESIREMGVVLENTGKTLVYVYDIKRERTGIAEVLEALKAEAYDLVDIYTEQSSLEDIFVELIGENRV